MENIEFRAKGIIKGEVVWVYGDLFKKWIQTNKNNGSLIYYIGSQIKDEHKNLWNEYWVVISETVGQYTTIDAYKSNTETERIYKGDIVEIVWDEIGSEIPQNFRGEVKFLEGKWVVDNGKELVNLWQELAQWIILGNVIDNPDLLTQRATDGEVNVF